MTSRTRSTAAARPRIPDPASPLFVSILHADDGTRAQVDVGELFADLNLDQVVDALCAGREGYRLDEFFRAPLTGRAAIAYRHDVVRDLQRPPVRDAVAGFARAMASMRSHRTQMDKLHFEHERQGWMLDSVAIYCDAVESLAARLEELDLASEGMRGLRSYLTAYAGSERFGALAAETRRLGDALAGVRYSLLIRGSRVTVGRYADEPDYTVEVERTFARFRRHAAETHLASLTDHVGMDHVEAWIVERVARLFPEVFEPLEQFCKQHADVVDAKVGRFDREVQFYLAYLEMIDSIGRAGLGFCLPEVCEDASTVAAEQTFDLALALKLAASGGEVVVNDVRLAAPERILVVSGPNNGGKTTYARTFGQLHYLAGLGLPVPGRAAQLQLPDRVFTHFEREEQIETLRGSSRTSSSASVRSSSRRLRAA